MASDASGTRLLLKMIQCLAWQQRLQNVCSLSSECDACHWLFVVEIHQFFLFFLMAYNSLQPNGNHRSYQLYFVDVMRCTPTPSLAIYVKISWTTVNFLFYLQVTSRLLKLHRLLSLESCFTCLCAHRIESIEWMTAHYLQVISSTPICWPKQ